MDSSLDVSNSSLFAKFNAYSKCFSHSSNFPSFLFIIARFVNILSVYLYIIAVSKSFIASYLIPSLSFIIAIFMRDL